MSHFDMPSRSRLPLHWRLVIWAVVVYAAKVALEAL